MNRYWLVTLGSRERSNANYVYSTMTSYRHPAEVLMEAYRAAPDLKHHVQFAVEITEAEWNEYRGRLP